MFLLLKMAFRNIFRNKRRTILSGFAIGIGLASLITLDAMIVGMKENMIRAATDFFPGQVQIHKNGYRSTFDTSLYINKSSTLMKDLKSEELVKSFTPRVASFSMITSPADVSSIMIYGIKEESEPLISKIKEVMKTGKYEFGNANKILLGNKLAETLQVGIGDRIVLTVAQAKTGELSQEMFRVGGTYSFKIDEMDSMTAMVEISKLQELLAIGSNIHEIALKFNDIKDAGNQNLPFFKKYSSYNNEALGWNKLFHDLESLIKMSQFSLWLSALVLFAVVALGIVNTLFMSLYERMFEFGILRAIGTRPFKMAFLIIFEAIVLSLISIVIGVMIGYLVTYVFSITGIDYIGYEFNNVTIQDLIYPVIAPYQYVVYPILLIIFITIVSFYPASYAARLKPAKALRKSF